MSPEEFATLVQQWKNMDRTTQEARDAESAFYDTKLFPLVKECFLGKPQNRPKRKYYGLILTVGLHPEPLILSILTIQPERVAFLHTPQTAEHLDRIQKETGLSLAQIDTRKIDGGDVTQMYHEIMEVYERWGRRSDIAVDITGGKKSMVSGAAMAGAVIGADIYYIDNEKFLPPPFGKPEPGSEFLSLLDNPYVVFGDLEVKKAAELYNGHDYVGALRIFDQLQKEVSEPNQEKAYNAYGLLCATYEAWDNLDIGKAVNHLNRLLELLEQFNRISKLGPLYGYQEQLKEQRKALECLRAIGNNAKLALEFPDGFHLAFTLYHNALRREKQGKRDIASLILYRMLEWIAQYRLAQYGIITDQPDYTKLQEWDIATLTDHFNQKRVDVLRKSEEKFPLPDKIGLMNGYLILSVFNDPIVRELEWSSFIGQINARNQSMLAHGFKMVPENQFKEFKKTAVRLFEKAQALAGIDAKAFERHRFIAPLPVA